MVDEKQLDRDAVVARIKTLAAQGAYQAARELCHQLCLSAPSDARPWMLLGAIYGQQQEAVLSEECLRKALAIDPAFYSAHYNLALILASQQRLEEAEQHFNQALRLRTDDAVIYYEFGNTLNAMRKTAQAIAVYRRAVGLQPRYRDAWYHLGNLLFTSQDLHAALGAIRSAFACDPAFVKAKAVEALILEKQGDIEAAWACLEPWLEREMAEPVFADALARVSLHLGKEQEAIDCLLKTIEENSHEHLEICPLYFRLGELQERLQRYDEAFESFTKGNELWIMPNNAQIFVQGLRESRKVYSKSVLASGLGAQSAGEGLIFILGMPRSGTSLVEQILGTHSKVLAGGESPWLLGLSGQVLSGLRTGDGNSVDFTQLTQEAAAGYASRYLSTMRANVGKAEFLTDKTPHNFEYIGLISILFPKAHVIHCVRNPLDTCTSCFCSNFVGENLAYSRDLQSLGMVYNEYASLMRYWKENAAVPILDVEYESMVDDTEQMVRRILDFCGLEWEQQCLQFYKQKRQVHTASYGQVRQPVYRKSVGRWKCYKKQLEPLKAILDSGVTDSLVAPK